MAKANKKFKSTITYTMSGSGKNKQYGKMNFPKELNWAVKKQFFLESDGVDIRLVQATLDRVR